MDSFSLKIREIPASMGLPVGEVFIPLVEKGKDAYREYDLIANHRGWFELVGLEISTQFPFGFWERSRGVALPRKILVFPEVFDHWPEESAALAIEGELAGKRLGRGDDLMTFRDFQNGDPVRSIHWKNSAKTDRLTVAVYHHPENRQVHVCLRTAYAKDSEGDVARHFEEAVSWAATFVTRLLERGVAVGYMDEQTRAPISYGDGHKLRILTHLALLVPEWNEEAASHAPTGPSSHDQTFVRIEVVPTGVRIQSVDHTGSIQEVSLE